MNPPTSPALFPAAPSWQRIALWSALSGVAALAIGFSLGRQVADKVETPNAAASPNYSPPAGGMMFRTLPPMPPDGTSTTPPPAGEVK